MCGIMGYTGNNDAREIILKGLSALEYRGYDSAGIGIYDNATGKVRVSKCIGKVKNLASKAEKENISGSCGIGHTRWATHGGVTEENAHPHQVGKVTLTHNGIIENYEELASEFGIEENLVSETDTEVACSVFNHYYNKYKEPFKAIYKAVKCFRGTFAFTIIFEDIPGKIFAVRNVSPIVAGKTEHGTMLASDLTALSLFTKEYMVLGEYQILVMDKDGLELYNIHGEKLDIEYLTIDWDMDAATKKGFPFYMEKEINEQPEVFLNTVEPHCVNGLPDFTEEGLTDDVFKKYDRIFITACGTAMHSGQVGKGLIEHLAHIPVETEIASEFIYGEPILDEKTLVISVSQSGETIDTLTAVHKAHEAGADTLGIVNVHGTAIARESDYVIYTSAGPEIAVASTKAYTVQLAVFYLLAAKLALVKGRMTEDKCRSFMKELMSVPEKIKKVIKDKDKVHKLATRIVEAKNVFMLGRGLDYYAILEGSLKLKEVSYIHSEALPAGEIKHGTIALISDETPVILSVTQDKLAAKEISNAKEVKSRGALVILLIKDGVELENEDQWDAVYRLPADSDELMIFSVTVALQFIAYFTALDLGLDVDKPRNLAKVVTVE